jgi:hypothetical protein
VEDKCPLSRRRHALTPSPWPHQKRPREAAEEYRIEGYSTIAEIYQPFLEGGIQVRGYDVPGGRSREGNVLPELKQTGARFGPDKPVGKERDSLAVVGGDFRMNV